MKKMITQTIRFAMFGAALIAGGSTINAQSVGVGTLTPNASAKLDVTSSNSGVLIPRLGLTSAIDATTISNGNVTSLLVYNTATAGSAPNDITPGYYYWNGTKWVRLAEAGIDEDHDWYEIGTTDAPDAITDFIYTQGQVGIGRTNANGTLDVAGRTLIKDVAGANPDIFVINGYNQNGIGSTSISMGSMGGAPGNGVMRLYTNAPRNQSIELTAQNGSHSYIDVPGGSHFGVGLSAPTSGKLQVRVDGSDATTRYGIYNYNIGGYTGTSSTYGMYNYNGTASRGIKYGFYNDVTAGGNAGTRYGIYNIVSQNSAATSGGVYGIRNYVNTTYGTSTKYGLYNRIAASSTSSATLYGINAQTSGGTGTRYGGYFSTSSSSTSANRIYGVYSTVTTAGSGNKYGVYSTVSTSGTGTKYGVYSTLSGSGNYGVYANNTSAGGHAAFFNGDTEVDNGWLSVGAATGSTTRTGVYETTWTGNYSFNDDGYRYYKIGDFDYPTTNLPTSVTVKKIVWEMDGYHQDANEDHGVWIHFGSSTGGTWYGWAGNAGNGAKDVNWHYVSGTITSTQSRGADIYMRVEDEDCTFCGSDQMRVFNMHIKIYYEYNQALQDGDIAASGRVYANTSADVGDMAEYFEVAADEEAGIGHVVVLKTGTDNEYALSKEPYAQHIVGVVSENPSVVLNSPKAGPPVALAGRVKVKVVAGNELIKSGDFLTTSAEAGKAMVATEAGPVIGYAVANQKEGNDYVEILVQPGRFYYPRPSKLKEADDKQDRVKENDEDEHSRRRN
ncbi:MAG: hypothetical protein GY810_08105 [Aureispira sp.]|nr:hypothetical protein [Aureispira sp.]